MQEFSLRSSTIVSFVLSRKGTVRQVNSDAVLAPSLAAGTGAGRPFIVLEGSGFPGLALQRLRAVS